jgi:glucose/mannose-6-phosphate isomerase
MRGFARGLPEHLREGFSAAAALDRPIPPDTRRAVVSGMGGSAISGDLAAALTDPETELSLTVVRGPELPRPVDGSSVVLLISYSGNTWEALEAYREAGRRGARRVTLGSGGRLREAAERDGVPHLSVPPGLPPRAAVGYLLGGLLGVLDPVFPESNEERFRAAVERLESRMSALGSPSGGPGRLAAAVGRRVPFVYADGALVGLARRWKTQVEENAKRIACFDQAPELFHNAIVAWDALRASEADRYAVVFLDWVAQRPEISARFRYLSALLRRTGVPSHRVPLDERDRLAAVLLGVAWGDAFSLALAERSRVDPYPFDAIERMKTELESTPASADGRPA